MAEHLNISNLETHIAIITGDPDRAGFIATLFDKNERIYAKRGYVIYRAWAKQNAILIVSTNIGAPSTAIVAEELIDLGITVIIRLGTCGAIQPFIAPGHLIISSGCVRDEGTSQQYINLAFPAISDPILFYELQRQASNSNHPFHTGITHCKDAYFMERPDKQIDPEHIRQQWASWRSAGVLATEMESAILFVLGYLRGIRTGAILVNVGKSTPEFENALKIAVQIIQQTIDILIRNNLIPQTRPLSPPGLSYLSKKSYQKD